MFSRLMETVFGASATWACSTEQLLIREESRVVEYKQTARWNVREQRRGQDDGAGGRQDRRRHAQ